MYVFCARSHIVYCWNKCAPAASSAALSVRLAESDGRPSLHMWLLSCYVFGARSTIQEQKKSENTNHRGAVMCAGCVEWFLFSGLKLAEEEEKVAEETSVKDALNYV